MAKYRITAPDGNSYEVTAPDSATQEEVLAYAKSNYQAAPAAKSVPQAQPKPRSVAAETARQLGLTARYALEGTGQALGVFSDPIALAIPGAGRASELASYAADKLGLPKPQGGVERVVAGATRAGFGALPTMGAGGVAAQAPGTMGRVGAAIAASPGYQLGASAAGGGAAETAREAGAGAGGQAVAGLVGAVAPAGAAGLARGVVRGGEAGRQRMADTIATFNRAGVQPSVGQAAGNYRTRLLESILGKAPGSSGTMAAFGESQQAKIGEAVEAVAKGLAPGATAEKAGRAIERGVTGAGGFMSQFRRKAGELYGKVDDYIAQDAPISVGKTKQTLDILTSPTPGAERTSQVLSSGRVADIRNALDADLQASLAAAGRGELPYSAVKQLRTRLGELIADSTFATDVPTKQLKQVYGALSDDLTAAATAKGPEALRAAIRANNFYRAGAGRLDALERVVERNGGGEKIYTAAISGTKDGATTLRGVMQSLPEDGRRMLASAFIRRLGRERPGVQNTAEAGFSAETFLTNYNNLSKEAKSAMFGRIGEGYQRDLEAVASAAASRRAGAEVLKNAPGTAAAGAQFGTAAGFVLSVLSGSPATAGLIAGGVLSGLGTAKAMTNPAVVRWLAQQTKLPTAALPQQIARLKADAQARGDEEALEFAAQIESGASQQAGNR